MLWPDMSKVTYYHNKVMQTAIFCKEHINSADNNKV